MVGVSRAAAVVAGCVLIFLAQAGATAALARDPLYHYTFTWFLKLGPGEAHFLIRYLLLGTPAVILLTWGLAPVAAGWERRVTAVFTPRKGRLLVAALTMAAVAVAGLWVLRDRMVTDDEYVYLFQSRTLLLGRMSLPEPPLSEFLKNVFVVSSEGRWFGQYPPGHPLILIPGALAGWPRIVPVFLAGANLLIAAAVLGRVAGGRAGAAGAILLATSPLFLLTGATLLSHTTALLALGLGLWAAMRAAEGNSPGWGGLAGLGTGLLFLARPWTGVTLGLFPVAILVWAARRGRRRPLLPAAVGLAVCGLAFLAYNAGVSGSPWVTGYQAVRGPGMTEFGFGTIFPGIHDHTPAQGLLNAVLLAVRFHVWSWGWPLALLPALFLFRPGAGPSPPGPAGLSERTVLLGAAGMIVLGFASYVPYWSIGVNDTGPVKTYELLLPWCVLTVLGARRAARVLGPGYPAAWMAASLLCAVVVFWPVQIRHLRELSARVEAPLVATGVQRPALVFVANMQPEKGTSWVYGRPNPRPDLSDAILYVRDRGPRNREYMALHPDRNPYRLVEDGDGFRVVPLRRESP